MTDSLSPAARAVVFATHKAMAEQQASLSGVPDYRQVAAAALRAAALHLHSEEYETCGGCSYALMIDVDDLLAIAAELDPTTTPSESD